MTTSTIANTQTTILFPESLELINLLRGVDDTTIANDNYAKALAAFNPIDNESSASNNLYVSDFTLTYIDENCTPHVNIDQAVDFSGLTDLAELNLIVGEVKARGEDYFTAFENSIHICIDTGNISALAAVLENVCDEIGY